MITAKEIIKKMGMDWRNTETSARRVAEFSANEINNLIEKSDELYLALEGILDIGKRDTTNPKYDGYYESAREAIKQYREAEKRL